MLSRPIVLGEYIIQARITVLDRDGSCDPVKAFDYVSLNQPTLIKHPIKISGAQYSKLSSETELEFIVYESIGIMQK